MGDLSDLDEQENTGVITLFRRGQWDAIPAWRLNLMKPLFTLFYAVREFLRDGGQNFSSSLAYTTALSLVPLLSVITSALAIFGAFEDNNDALILYLEPVFPAAAGKAAQYLQEFARTSATSVGGVSAVGFLVVSVLLFLDVEKTFNTIWQTPNSRPLFKKLSTFYFVVTFGPILATTSVGLTARAQVALNGVGVELGFFAWIAPFLITFLLFTGMHWSLPSTNVRWRSAILGGLFTALAFEAAKFGFNLYVTHVLLESYDTIYGAIGLFPIFLVWIYICWIVVLLGAELAYTDQNLRTIVDLDDAQRRMPTKTKLNIFNPLVGLEVMGPVARQFKEGHGGFPVKDLICELGYHEGFLREVVEELERIGAVRTVDDPETGEHGLIPAKQLEDIDLIGIVENFFDYSDPNSAVMAELQEALQRVTADTMRDKTAFTLVETVP